MALTTALFTGLSGLDVNQTKLNVVGNNIANANTTGFKSSRALFTSQFYVTDAAGTSPDTDNGGINPSQRGLGATVASIQKDFSEGSIEATGVDTDMAIDGNGFFIVRGFGSPSSYTRDGSFTLNPNNQLVASNGAYLQGYSVDKNGNVITGALQDMTIPLGTKTEAKSTKNVQLNGNLDASGETAAGASVLNSQDFTIVNGGGLAPAPDNNTALTDLASATASGTSLFSVGDTLTLAGEKGGRDLSKLTYTVTSSSTLGDLANFYQQGLGIDTSVPDDGDATTPTAGVTVDSTGSTAHLTIVGNLGTDNALSLSGSALSDSSGTAPLAFNDGQTAGGIKSDASGESVYTSYVAYDSLGTPLTVNVTAVLESKTNTGTTWRFYATSADDSDNKPFADGMNSPGTVLGNGTLSFDNNGKLLSSTGTSINITREGTGATSPLTVKMDFNEMTALTSQSSEMVMTEQDGSASGTLNSYSIGTDGKITGSYSNGQTRTLGQIALASFNNPNGLIDEGGGLYEVGADSGVAVVTAPEELGAGSIRSGSLESSNVDISKEFTNMIIASTGFSAASKVITTSDQLLTDLLNSTR